jgi:ABC-2 type transport system permease protein
LTRELPRYAAIAALVRRDYAIIRSYRLALASDLLFGLLSLGVYFFVSETFEGVSGVGLTGAENYFAFAAVGVAISVVIQGAAAGLSIRIREEQLTGTLEALAVHPVTHAELALGMAGFPFLMGMGRAVIYLGVASPWMELDPSTVSWLGVLVALAVTAAAVTAIGIALGALVLIFKRGGTIALLVTFAMGALGGAVFPVAVLPGVLQVLSDLMPTKASFDAVRHALFLGSGWGSPALTLAGFAVVAIPMSIWFFGAAIRINKRRGSLSQY